MDNSSRICIVAPCIAMGGIERASVNLANELSQMGYAVTFIALFKKEHFFELNSNIDFIEPVHFNIRSLSIPRSLLWLRKNIRSSHPDTVLVFNKFYSALVILSLVFARKFPVHISERSSPFFRWAFKLRIIQWLALKNMPPDGVISQTKIASEYQQQYYPKGVRHRIIPNALREINLFSELIRKPYILAVGRFNDPLKGFDQLIAALPYLKMEGWKLLFAGGDENGEYLKEQAVKLGVREQIEFLGKVKEIDRCYAEASIFVIPSRSEGFPNALCEAMAAGLACVSFDFVAGPRDLIEHGKNGLLAENGNEKELARQIQLLIDNETLRKALGAEAMKIAERLNPRKIAEEVASFIIPN